MERFGNCSLSAFRNLEANVGYCMEWHKKTSLTTYFFIFKTKTVDSIRINVWSNVDGTVRQPLSQCFS